MRAFLLLNMQVAWDLAMVAFAICLSPTNCPKASYLHESRMLQCHVQFLLEFTAPVVKLSNHEVEFPTVYAADCLHVLSDKDKDKDLFRIRIYLLARRNLLWDILRLPSSRRAALGLYVSLTL